MWIVPKQLQQSSGAPAMLALDLDSKQSLVRDCDASHILMLRGLCKPISSVKWKRDSWMRHLYGRILKPSHAKSFTDWWTSSLRDTHASRSATPEGASGMKTPATSSLISNEPQRLCAPGSSSLKTLKDLSLLNSPEKIGTIPPEPPFCSMSLESWNALVTQRRSEFSQRLKSARLTSGKECLSWPTICTAQNRNSPGAVNLEGSAHQNHGVAFGLEQVVEIAGGTMPKECKGPLPEFYQKMWPTSSTRGYKDTPGMGTTRPDREVEGRLDQLPRKVYAEMSGLPAPVPASTDGSRQESLWASPRTAGSAGSKNVMYEPGKKPTVDGKPITTTLTDQVKVDWPILTEEEKLAGPPNAKLNPRWVETLMGLPMGWTSPDAPASLIRNWKKFTDGWLKAQTGQTS